MRRRRVWSRSRRHDFVEEVVVVVGNGGSIGRICSNVAVMVAVV